MDSTATRVAERDTAPDTRDATEERLLERLERGPPWPKLIGIVLGVGLFISCAAYIQFVVVLGLTLRGPLVVMPAVVALTLGSLLSSAWFFYDQARANAQLLAFEQARRARLLEELEELVEIRGAQLRETEARMQTQQKFAALGRLSGGIAHDFNNILTTVSLGVFELGEPDTEASERERLIEAISRACERGAGITRQLQAISAAELNRPVTVDLARLVAEDLGMWRTLAPAGIELSHTVPETPLLVRVDPAQLHRVVLNLVVNACQAMGEFGSLHLELGQREQAATLSVVDSGPGIPPEVADKIFEPFFTTKPEGKGTGLGLAVVHGIIEQAGGHIELETSAAGTTFRVVLPILGEGTPLAKAREHASGPSERALRIALLDDDESITTMVARSLTRAGHRVAHFTHPSALLEDPSSYDLLITDVSLPVQSGPDLALELLDTGRIAQVILMSGYVDDSAKTSLDRLANATFLQKPFSQGELLETLAACCGPESTQ